MSVGPRIVFTRFASSTSPKLTPWREHVRRVTGAVPPLRGFEPESAPVIVWNLVSANNRELGRGTNIYQRFDDAVLDAQRLITECALLDVASVSGDRDGFYGWRASYNGTAELVCSRWYQTESALSCHRDERTRRRDPARGRSRQLPLAHGGQPMGSRCLTRLRRCSMRRSHLPTTSRGH
jgi:hypothetical protein